MIKAILKDAALAAVTIAAQVGMNMVQNKENDWLFIIMVGLVLGAADFFISFLKGKLESINYTIDGITRGTTKKRNMKK